MAKPVACEREAQKAWLAKRLPNGMACKGQMTLCLEELCTAFAFK